MSTSTIGRYEIKRELGRGGMATVYMANDPRFEREVAIKILPKMFLHDPQFRARFDREAKMIALLEHPSIVPVYDFGEDDGQPYIVMRLMTGGDLGEKIKQGPMPTNEVSKILTRLAHALDVAHAKGIIHRDLKPGNILFDQYQNAFLSDFGIARLKEAEGTLTGSAIIGTPAYMSPEQIQGDAGLDGRSDIYALGVIVFQMLTGQMPYRAETPAKIMMMHILEPVPKINTYRPDLPPTIASVIEKALAKKPDDRYQTAQAFAAALEEAMAGVSAQPGTRPTYQPSPAEMTVTAAPAAKTQAHTPLPTQPPTPLPTQAPPAQAVNQTAVALPQAPPKKRRFPMMAFFGAVAGVLVLGGAAIAFNLFGPGQAELPTSIPASATIPAAATVPPTATENTQILVASATSEPPTATWTPTIEATSTNTPEPTATFTPEPTPTPARPVIGGADMVAYVRNGDIWVANLDGSEHQQLTTDGQSKAFLEWTPDGGQLMYQTGKCIKSFKLGETQPEDILCVNAAEYFEGFAVSPDNSQIAVSVDNQLYIVPFDIPQLQAVRLRTDLTALATCKEFAPYTRNAVKNMYWSEDAQQLAALILGVGPSGTQQQVIQILDVSTCTNNPRRLDEFPGTRFTPTGYEKAPVLFGVDWDGLLLFTMNTFIRNDGFGDLWVYNAERKTAEKVNPVDGKCCYRDSQWSPDSRMLLFAFQDIGQGAGSQTYLYYVAYSQINTGLQLVALPIDPLPNPKEAPYPALRPAVSP